MERIFSIKTVEYKWTFISIGICFLSFLFPPINAWYFYVVALLVLFFFSYIPSNTVKITITDNSISGSFNEYQYRNTVSKEFLWSDIKLWKSIYGRGGRQTLKITTNDGAVYKINAASNFTVQKEFMEMISLFKQHVNLYNTNNPGAEIKEESSIWG